MTHWILILNFLAGPSGPDDFQSRTRFDSNMACMKAGDSWLSVMENSKLKLSYTCRKVDARP